MSEATLYNPPPLNSDRAALENILRVVPVSESRASATLFTNAYPLWKPPPGAAVFGGLLIGLAIQSAYQTVHSGFVIHHLSCSFFKGPDHSRPLYFHVTRPLDTSRHAAREVRAYQDEELTILSITCRFVAESAAIELHSTKAPRTSSLPPSLTAFENDPAFAKRMIRSDFLRHFGQDTSRADIDPFVWHYCEPKPDTSTIDLTSANIMANSSPASYQLYAWVRSRDLLSKDHASRMAVLGFLTDSYLLTAVKDLIPQHVGPNLSRVKRMATMVHHVWFHEAESHMDDWLLVRTQVTWAAQGRCLLQQHMWSRQGRLVLSCVQEGALRVTAPTALGEPVNHKL